MFTIRGQLAISLNLLDIVNVYDIGPLFLLLVWLLIFIIDIKKCINTELSANMQYIVSLFSQFWFLWAPIGLITISHVTPLCKSSRF